MMPNIAGNGAFQCQFAHFFSRFCSLSAFCFLIFGIHTGVHADTPSDALATIKVENAWMRAVPVPGMNGAVYLHLTNTADHRMRLTRVLAPWADEATLHRTRMNNGVHEMVELDEGLVLPPGKTVSLQPGGVHIMVMGVESLLEPGDQQEAQLVFSNGLMLTVPIEIKPVTYQPSGKLSKPNGHQESGNE